MDKNLFEQYLKDRYEKQNQWYSKNAKINKFLFHFFQVIVILFSVITPVILALNRNTLTDTAIVTSAAVGIVTGVMSLFKFQENWINYRTVSESLKKEFCYFNAKLHDYQNSSDPEQLFVSKVENSISRENSIWENCQSENPPKVTK